jgi:probable HAF family extracellular repeat protein
MEKFVSRVLGKRVPPWMIIGLLALAAHAPVAKAQAPQYTATILGTLGYPALDGVNGINNSGIVVGSLYTADHSSQSAVVWDGTETTVLGTLGASLNAAVAINNLGVVAGDAGIPSGGQNAVKWTGTTATLIGGYAIQEYALGINDEGLVVGTDGRNAVEWTGTSEVVFTTAPSAAFKINDQGVTVGTSYENSFHNDVAVEWNGTTPTILGDFGGMSEAWNINSLDQVVGYISVSSTVTDAVEWTGTTPTILGSLGGTESYATAINDSGEVVGYSMTTGNSAQDGFLAMDGTMYDVNALLAPGSGMTVYNVEGINDSGQMAADAMLTDGSSVAVLLTPVSVPEPSMWLILGSGIPLLAGAWRSRAERRKRPGTAHG